MGDWNVKGQDIDQRMAKYGRTRLTDEESWNLSKAFLVYPGIGCPLYLAHVSGVSHFSETIIEWAVAAAASAMSPRYKGKWGRRLAVPARIKDPIARKQAGLDGVWLAIYGLRLGSLPSLRERAAQFQIDREAYGRIRDAVQSDAINKIHGFRYALEWAFGYVRDRGYDDALKTANQNERDSLKWEVEETDFPKFSSGCTLTPPAPLSDSVEAWPE